MAAALGITRPPARERLRISALIAGFEAGMPLVGLGLGVPLAHPIAGAANYVAAGILIALGLVGLVHDEDEQHLVELSRRRGRAALLIGLSVSTDELAIGFALGLLHVPVVPVVIAIGLQAFLLSQLGLRVGAGLSVRRREGAERLASIGLALIGVVLLIEKLAAG